MITQQEKDAFLHREYCYLAKLSELDRCLLREKQMSSEIQAAFEDSTSKTSLRQGLVDPVVNMEILLLRQKLREKEQKIESLQDEINSSSFDPKSISGQKLMKKCRALLEENQDLGRQLAEEKFQDLTVLLKAEKKKCEQLKEKLKESTEFCSVLDDENEKLQLAYQQLLEKLKAAHAEIVDLRRRVDMKVPPDIPHASLAAIPTYHLTANAHGIAAAEEFAKKVKSEDEEPFLASLGVVVEQQVRARADESPAAPNDVAMAMEDEEKRDSKRRATEKKEKRERSVDRDTGRKGKDDKECGIRKEEKESRGRREERESKKEDKEGRSAKEDADGKEGADNDTKEDKDAKKESRRKDEKEASYDEKETSRKKEDKDDKEDEKERKRDDESRRDDRRRDREERRGERRPREDKDDRKKKKSHHDAKK